jgi:hypothetical protein
MPVTIGTVPNTEVYTLADLTATGTSEVISTSGPHIYFSVTSSGVTGAVVVRFEGSLTNAAGSFFNLSTSNADITISTNTTEAYYTQAPVKFVRANVISIASGTPTIKVSIGVCR